MRFTFFSINPIFQDRVTGGASKHLVRLSRHMTSLGHDVTILCAQAAPGQQPFVLSGGARVEPSLHFHQPFPQPYAIAPGELANIVETLQAHLSQSDRFYIHDGELLLPFVYDTVPTVSSFRDNIYPESVLGSFLTQADEIIAVSPYSAAVIKASAGRLRPGLNHRIHDVSNGIDPEVFHPTDPAALKRKLGIVDPQKQIILHPHRPEEGKGLAASLEVLNLLVHRYGFDQLLLLAPRWLEDMEGLQEDRFYQSIQAKIAAYGLQGNVLFHPWLAQDQMAACYSMASLSLCLGSFVEAFGNTAYESLCCGTPTIAARIGTHRSQLPDSLIDKVDPQDWDTAAAMAAEILRSGRRVTEEQQRQILEVFSLQKQLETYADILINVQKRPNLAEMVQPSKEAGKFMLAPWCYVSAQGIYHDYAGRYYTAADVPGFDRLVAACVRDEYVLLESLPAATLQGAAELTILVPAD